ncbi:Ger(x)C family spore germination protein [Paenibacillus sp. GCM10012306]|uniref:Ger(x)C family spore germination protein n=1 Tax=Paenibacillus sp. GCM10012306 TaxID=3317342 RepID=UPI0036170A5C
MRRLSSILLSLLVLSLTSGCWDNNELDEYGYVQAIAIDQGEDNRIEITTHFYNPSNKMEAGGDTTSSASKGTNIRTSGETFFEAIREIPAKFGRKAKWDHMRVILIGEQLARSSSIREVLDFFSRDHEPRGTILPLIAEQSASQFLNTKPFIENTIGQQYKKMETTSAHYSAKTSDIPLYDLAIQLSSPSKASAIPYLVKSGPDQEAKVSGVALIQNGKMVGTLGELETETFMMLTGSYRYGVLEFPCMNHTSKQTHKNESLEVLTFSSKLTPTVKDDNVFVDVDVAFEGTIGELSCSHLKTNKDMSRFEQTIKEQVEKQLEHTLTTFKTKKVDVLGIGNQIYRRNPKLWNRLKPTWDQKLAQMQFRTKVNVKVLSTGMNTGTIFGTKEK